MAATTQSRKWMLTINNPQTCGLDAERIREILTLFCPDYYCMADEVATTGTYHTHIFLYSRSPIRFQTVKNRFPTAHIEKAIGSASENRDYIQKGGKWADTDKAETSVEGTFYEFGMMPSESEEKDPKMFRLLQNVKDGLSTTEIIDESPSFAFKSRDIDTLREAIMYERYRSEYRDIQVTYLFGASGSGKTSGIYEKHPATEICRITDYGGRNGIRFDSYHGQDVLVFEEFNSQIPIETMLNYLDVYPLMLPARYTDRVACYTKVYITSNLSLGEQYKAEQQSRPETWNAFLRRIHKVYAYHADGTVDEVDFK
ncbi:MAG: viral replication protein [Ruminococcaceae bacterium]|nr:viral replication protein [Oscillospiraceae bacterium]